MDPINAYAKALEEGMQPALLLTPTPISSARRLSVLGLNPVKKFEVYRSVLYINGRKSGDANDFLKHLYFGNRSQRFFPAFIGFFSYEFARHSGLKTNLPQEGFPEAAFFLYEKGLVWHNEKLIEGVLPFKADDVPICPSPPLTISSSITDQEFLDGVEHIQEKIREGQVYQVNLSRRFEFDATKVSRAVLLKSMREQNPSPFMALIEGADWGVLSGSPERLFNCIDGQVSTRPIAGTRRRGPEPVTDLLQEIELLSDPKERAEHAMLVDLLRNDLAKIASTSVECTELFTVERYSHVMHLVSEIRTHSSARLAEIFCSIFPGGTITGAPKASVMEVIAECEKTPRGAYTGSLGYISSGYGSDFNILIRSCYFHEKMGYFSAGAGIVIDSIPQRELAEVSNKAENIRVLLTQKPSTNSGVVQSQDKTANIEFAKLKQSKRAHSLKNTNCIYPRKKVLFVENNDSFSYNIVDALKSAGCSITIATASEVPQLTADISHLVIGPGPGTPRDSPHIFSWLTQAVQNDIPLLGVCLGHQALGVYFGADLQRSAPIHGQAQPVFHNQHPLFFGINNPTNFARYHSLSLVNLSKPLTTIGWLANGQIMAISHDTKPAFGVQFHPESFLSAQGQQIFVNFLKK